MNLRYPALFEPQEPSGYFVRFIDLPEAITQGETIEECRFNAAEVLSLILEDRLEEGRLVPPPSAGIENAHWITPDPNIQAALLIRLSREAEHKSLAELARALDASWPAAERLESPRYWPTLRQLDRAAAALGKRLVLSFE
jgi:antitoxin HicB